MRYLCMVFYDEQKLETLTAGDYDALLAEGAAYVEELRRGDHLVFAQAIERVQTATTVRVRAGKLSAADGPFAETKEQIGAFAVIEARDLNEAIQLASRMPPARLGGVEVRPVRPCPPPSTRTNDTP
jgi:hypothetical protein